MNFLKHCQLFFVELCLKIKDIIVLHLIYLNIRDAFTQKI